MYVYFRELQSYYTHRPAVSLAVSQRGLLALGRGRVVEVWRDVMGEVGGTETGGGASRGEKQKAPYLTHGLKGESNVVEFYPFEDCLGIGHSGGFTSIIVPGMATKVTVLIINLFPGLSPSCPNCKKVRVRLVASDHVYDVCGNNS